MLIKSIPNWFVVTAMVFVVSSTCAIGADDARVPLLEGNNGIAARFPGDNDIENDPDVLFVERFDEKTVEQVFSRWNEAKHGDDMSLSDDVVPGSADGQSLLMTQIGGKNSGPHLYRQIVSDETGKGYEQLYARFYVKIASDCSPIHHFGTCMGGNNPPTRWPMVSAGNRTDGNKSFWSGIEPHGGNKFWDYYTYWHEMRACPTGSHWGNTFVRDKNLVVEKDKWVCVEVMMKMNDPVNSYTGEQAFWIDGKLWRKDGQIISHYGPGFPKGKWVWDHFDVDPNGEPFEGYRWRKTKDLDVNYIWAYLYITKSPEGHKSKVWFDNIVVAKSYIGPLVEKKKVD